MGSQFVMYKDGADEWRWRFLASNGEVIADSGEGYKNKADCRHGIQLVKDEAPDAPIREKG